MLYLFTWVHKNEETNIQLRVLCSRQWQMFTVFWYMYKGKIYKDYKIIVDTEGTEKAMGDSVGKRNTHET